MPDQTTMYSDWLASSAADATMKIHALKQAVYAKTNTLEDLGAQIETLEQKASDLAALERVYLSNRNIMIFGAEAKKYAPDPIEELLKLLGGDAGEIFAPLFPELMPEDISSIEIWDLGGEINTFQKSLNNDINNKLYKYSKLKLEIKEMSDEIDTLVQGVHAIEDYL